MSHALGILPYWNKKDFARDGYVDILSAASPNSIAIGGGTMAQSRLALLCLALTCIFLSGCTTAATFNPINMNLSVDTRQYDRDVDNFLIILDASGSMSDIYNGEPKIETAKKIVRNMIATISGIPLNGGLRIFGKSANPFSNKTELLVKVDGFDKKNFESALDTLAWAGGKSPVAMAIKAASGDLENTKGKIALIIVSDGIESGNASERAAELLKSTYGDKLCIHTVLVGDDPAGKKIMDRLAQKGKCGLAQPACLLSRPGLMACFVARVFLKKGPDQDNDGVSDLIDQCPDTPGGASVDGLGCWELSGLCFKTNKADISSKHYPIIDRAVVILKQNPGLKIQIVGHADSRGPEKFNQKLSLDRALIVMDYMVKKGVGPEKLSAKGVGSNLPVAPNNTETGRAQNRRVSLTPEK